MLRKSLGIVVLFTLLVGHVLIAANPHRVQLKKVAANLSKQFEGKKLLLLGESTHNEPEFLELIELLAESNSETIEFIAFEKLIQFKIASLEAAEKKGKLPRTVVDLPSYYKQAFQLHLAIRKINRMRKQKNIPSIELVYADKPQPVTKISKQYAAIKSIMDIAKKEKRALRKSEEQTVQKAQSNILELTKKWILSRDAHMVDVVKKTSKNFTRRGIVYMGGGHISKRPSKLKVLETMFRMPKGSTLNTMGARLQANKQLSKDDLLYVFVATPTISPQHERSFVPVLIASEVIAKGRHYELFKLSKNNVNPNTLEKQVNSISAVVQRGLNSNKLPSKLTEPELSPEMLAIADRVYVGLNAKFPPGVPKNVSSALRGQKVPDYNNASNRLEESFDLLVTIGKQK